MSEYIKALKAQRDALKARAGYVKQWSEDGVSWYAPVRVRPEVIRKLCKLSRLIDMARNGNADPLSMYRADFQCRTQRISERTLNEWYAGKK